MLKEEHFIQRFMLTLSFLSAILLDSVYVSVLNLSSEGILGITLAIVNLIHVTFALFIILILSYLKMTGTTFFANENREKQSDTIFLMTFAAFSLLFLNSQAFLIGNGNDFAQSITDAFLFATFLSGGVVYTMLWGLNIFFWKKKEAEEPKESIQLYGVYGVGNIQEFETDMYQLSNNLYRLKEMEEELSQEEIIRLNRETDELRSLFVVYKKMSETAREVVVQDILNMMRKINQKVERKLYSKDEKYIRYIKKKTKKVTEKPFE